LNERGNARELAERERERGASETSKGRKKSVLFSREREPSPLLCDCQLSFIVSSRARERRRGRQELESCLGGERESRKRLSKRRELLKREQFGRERSRRTSKAHFFLSKKKNLETKPKNQRRLRRGPPGRRLGPHGRVRGPPARIRRGRPVPRSRLQPLC